MTICFQVKLRLTKIFKRYIKRFEKQKQKIVPNVLKRDELQTALHENHRPTNICFTCCEAQSLTCSSGVQRC